MASMWVRQERAVLKKRRRKEEPSRRRAEEAGNGFPQRNVRAEEVGRDMMSGLDLSNGNRV